MPKLAPSVRHDAAPAEDSGSHAVKVQLRLREMILAGELAAGSRITELGMVERLGVSRTPIRAALIRLEQEGLLQMLPAGGYVVRTFSESDVADAIELRGTLEGLAARRAAERGVDDSALAPARQLLRAIDDLLARSELDDAAFGTYVQLNRRFHELLAGLARSPVLQREIERVCGMPFASPSGFVIQQATSPRARDMLWWHRISTGWSSKRSASARARGPKRFCASTRAWPSAICGTPCRPTRTCRAPD